MSVDEDLSSQGVDQGLETLRTTWAVSSRWITERNGRRTRGLSGYLPRPSNDPASAFSHHSSWLTLTCLASSSDY